MIRMFPGWGMVMRTGIVSLLGLAIIGIILACVMGGVATATEAAAIAVAYSMLLTIAVRCSSA
jgi:TRAP-type C4-dicarboxylate transport system permease large subunit